MKKPSEGIMTKTPGQVAHEHAWQRHNEGAAVQVNWEDIVERRGQYWEEMAAAVIAHARPQIEAEARAAMVEQVIELDLANVIARDVAEIPYRDSPEDQPEMMLVTQLELRDIVERHIELIGELAALPPTHVCVPLELTDDLCRTIAVIAHVWPESDKKNVPAAFYVAIRKYHKAMLAASKVDQCPKTTP